MHVPPRPTEAVIALSILFLAVEVVHKRQGKIGLTERAPWIVAFLFGLFHGLGFAGALTEVELPEHAIPLSLFMFNVGVESGQILFVCDVLAVMMVLRRVAIASPAGSWRSMTDNDMNEWCGTSESLRVFHPRYHVIAPGRSFPALMPVASLDRIIISPELFVDDAGVHRSGKARIASDHLPVWAQLSFADRR